MKCISCSFDFFLQYTQCQAIFNMKQILTFTMYRIVFTRFQTFLNQIIAFFLNFYNFM